MIEANHLQCCWVPLFLCLYQHHFLVFIASCIQRLPSYSSNHIFTIYYGWLIRFLSLALIHSHLSHLLSSISVSFYLSLTLSLSFSHTLSLFVSSFLSPYLPLFSRTNTLPHSLSFSHKHSLTLSLILTQTLSLHISLFYTAFSSEVKSTLVVILFGTLSRSRKLERIIKW